MPFAKPHKLRLFYRITWFCLPVMSSQSDAYVALHGPSLLDSSVIRCAVCVQQKNVSQKRENSKYLGHSIFFI